MWSSMELWTCASVPAQDDGVQPLFSLTAPGAALFARSYKTIPVWDVSLIDVPKRLE